MKNRKKYLFIIICSFLAVIMPVYILTYAYHSIPVSLIENSGEDGIREIIGVCLKDMAREDYYNADDVLSFSTFYGDITEDSAPDLIIAIKFNNTTTLMPVYSKIGSRYVYKGELGPFYDVESVEFRYMDNLSKNAVFINEKTNESLGSFQTNNYIQGFAFIDGSLTNIISIPTDIEAYWNENFLPEGLNKWDKIAQESAVNWIEGNCPKIILEKEQILSSMDGSSKERINSDENFKAENHRTVIETYVWSDKWKSFILGEKVYLPSGETVAVLEDLNNQPYVLAGFDTSKSRVLHENGKMMWVGNKDLKQ